MFNIDTLRAEAQFEPFTFVLEGEQFTLPHIRTLPSDLALNLDEGDFKATLPTVAGEDLANRLLAQPVFVLEKLLEEWVAHAGMQQGESVASTGS